jgi:transmembrane sensor
VNKTNGHIDLNINSADNPGDILQHLEIHYDKSREEVWAELDKKISEKPTAKLIIFNRHKLSYGIAAAILLLAGVFSLMRFYTVTVTCPEGQHLSYVLPDGSKIEMNVDSKIAYQPFWWRFSRKLKFEGEGYFMVEKGKRFEVVSDLGSTEVLGTTFNIYSRDNDYKVTCLTGRVKVTSFKSEVAVLSPNDEANISPDGNIVIRKDQGAEESIFWVNNMFSFTSKPLSQVFNEIARQYGVKIIINSRADYFYTGYFSKDKPIGDVLTLVCKPFGLTFARFSDKEYEIFQN